MCLCTHVVHVQEVSKRVMLGLKRVLTGIQWASI